jgi:hypothetical protein
MATFSNIGLQEPSTITNRVAAVTIARGSTNEQQEILVLGDPESSLAIARVLDQAPNSTDWGVVVRPMGYSTTAQVSSVGGVVSVSPVSTAAVRANLSSTSTDNPVSAAQAGAWTVSVSGYSTTVNVSSVAGKVAVVNSSAGDLLASVSQASTVWAVQLSNYSTTAQVSSVGGIVTQRPSDTNWASSAGFHFDSSGALNVAGTFSASTTVQVSSLAGRVALAGYHAVAGIVNVTDSTNNAINVNVVAGSAAGSTITTVSQLLDSSGGSITAGDSANQAIRVNVVAGAAGGSTIVTVSTGSVRVHQSSAADLNVTVAGYSTVVSVSTGSVRVHQSSAADLNVTVAGYSTIVSVAAFPSGILSTAAPSSNSSGVIVRQVVDALTTFASTAACASTSIEVQSSAANLRSYVTAFTVLTTVASATEMGFYTTNTLLWPFMFQAVSSGITGANLAVGGPAYLFRTGIGESLSFRSPNSTVAGVKLGVSFFRAP